MFTFLSWLIIIIEVLFVCFLAFVAIKKRKISLTENSWYFVPSLLILYALYAIDLIYTAMVSGVAPSVYAFLNIIESCYNVFKAVVSYEGILLLTANSVYPIAFFIGVVLALGVFISFAINVVCYFFYSKISAKKILRNGCDILISEDKDAEVYMQNYNSVIRFLQQAPSKEQKKYYREKKIVYLVGEIIDEKLLSIFSKFVNNGKNYNIVCLKEHDYTLKTVAVFKRFVKNTKAENFYLHVEFNYKNHKSINEVILEDKEFTAYINCFNKYELIARKFVQNYPVTKFIPSGFFDYEKGVIKENKKINVLYVGFGETSSALLETSIINDRLVSTEDGKVKELFVNYYIYDKEKCKNESTNSAFYNDRYLNIDYSKGEYFERIEKIVNLNYKCVDIGRKEGSCEYQERLKCGENEFNNIVIALGSDAENIDTAIKTIMFLRQNDIENHHIFIRLKTESEEYKDYFSKEKVTFFGDEGFIINHSVIVDEALIQRAKDLNRSYEEKRKAINKWVNLSAIKKLSNIYAGLNLRLKLNLLGYDLQKNNGKNFDNRINEKLICKLSKETPRIDSPYQDFLFFNGKGFNSANAIAYQEKLRWNAFYIVNGYAPMNKEEIKVQSINQIVKDDDEKKLHGCLTTVEGLDEYHRLIAQKLGEITGESEQELLKEVNTYKYDYMVLDAIKTLDKDSPMVIVKRS